MRERAGRSLSRGYTAALAAATIGLLAVAALASRGLPAGAGGRLGNDLGLDLHVPWLLATAAAIALVAAGFLVWLLWPDEDEDWRPPPPRRPYVQALLALIALTAVAVLVRPLADAEVWSPGGGGAAGTAAPVDEESTTQPGSPWAIALMVAAVGMAVVALSAARGRASSGPQHRPGVPAEADAGATRATPVDVVPAGPRGAVIAAYVDFERALTHRRLGREPSEAPDEYLRRTCLHMSGARDDAHRLTRLFELARFSRHVLDAADGQRARAALDAVRAELRDGRRR